MEIILASIVSFATTNLDDIFILTIFFTNPEFTSKNVIAGQYLGIISLIVVSLIGSFIGLIFDQEYIGLLGLVPMYIGVKSVLKLIEGKQKENDDGSNVSVKFDNLKRNQILAVSSMTVANGGDNISIYIPLFAPLTSSEKLTMAAIFLAMTALWCLLAKYASRHPMVKHMLQKYGHVITPFVFIVLGIYIMYESGTINLLFRGINEPFDDGSIAGS